MGNPFDIFSPTNVYAATKFLNGPGRLIADTLNPFGNPLTAGKSGAAPKQSFSGMGSAVGKSLQNVISQVNNRVGQMQQMPQQDPLAEMYSQLINQLQQPVASPTGVNSQDLMAQIRGAIDPIYDQRANAATARTGKARTEVKGMYDSLAKDYERLAPQQVAQADAAQQEIENMYGQLRSNIEGSYSRVSKEQGDLFKQLGIEAALPEVLGSQQELVNEDLAAASKEQAQQEQRYMDIGQMDSTYFREGAPNAQLTGTNMSKDMLFELEQYLNQNDAERSAGIQTSYMDQLTQAQNQLAQQQQNAQSENARRQGMLFDMLNQQMQIRNQPQQPLTTDSFMAQLQPAQQQQVGAAFTQLQRSPEAIYGKVEDPRNPVPGSFVDTNPEWFMAQADQMLQSGQIDEATHQALLQYMQLYFGMGSK